MEKESIIPRNTDIAEANQEMRSKIVNFENNLKELGNQGFEY